MAVLKTADWQLFMHYGQLAANHAQQEALNYELYRNASPVSLDQGTVRLVFFATAPEILQPRRGSQCPPGERSGPGRMGAREGHLF